jgi:hypothetical protein
MLLLFFGEKKDEKVSWLKFLHEIADVVSTYAGLFGLSLQVVGGYLYRQFMRLNKKRKSKKELANESRTRLSGA